MLSETPTFTILSRIFTLQSISDEIKTSNKT